MVVVFSAISIRGRGQLLRFSVCFPVFQSSFKKGLLLHSHHFIMSIKALPLNTSFFLQNLNDDDDDDDYKDDVFYLFFNIIRSYRDVAEIVKGSVLRNEILL